MPGQPTFNVQNAYSSQAAPGVAGSAGGGSSTAFIVWLLLLGIVLPAVVLGGLRMGGFSFVFKGR